MRVRVRERERERVRVRERERTVEHDSDVATFGRIDNGETCAVVTAHASGCVRERESYMVRVCVCVCQID